MENNLSPATNNLPGLMNNTHINITLDGWPATVAIMSVCVAFVSAYAIKFNSAQHNNNSSIKDPITCTA